MTNNIDDLNFDNLILKKEEVDMIIYHGGCVDGFTSAFSAYKFLSTTFPERDVKYIPASFDKPPPAVEGKNVCICDFSYKKTILEEMLKKANKLIILDHHKTAQEELLGVPDENKIFRMDHSGAYLTWRYFHFDKPVPDLILYVEDTDIWTKKLPNTNELATAIHTTTQTFEEYEKLLDNDYLRTRGLQDGSTILKQTNNDVSRAIKNATPKLIYIDKQYQFVAYLNSSVFKSDIGHRVFELYPDANFSGIYSIDDYSNSTIFSLRSTDNRTDVSRIAKIFGGGGHRNASGVRISSIVSSLPGTMNEHNKLYSSLKTIYFGTIRIDTAEFNVVYANIESNKSTLGRYLVQHRYNEVVNGTFKSVQECISIMRNKIGKENLSINECHLSVMWNYNGYEDKTWMTIVFSNNLSIENKQMLLQYFNSNGTDIEIEDEVNVQKIIISKSGLVGRL